MNANFLEKEFTDGNLVQSSNEEYKESEENIEGEIEESEISSKKIPFGDFVVNFNSHNINENALNLENSVNLEVPNPDSKKTEIRKNSSFNAFVSLSNVKRTLYKLISTFYMTKKFIKNLKNSTIYREPRFLKKFHFQIINDNSFDIKGYKGANTWLTNKFSPSLEMRIRKILDFSNHFLVNPDNVFRLFFDMLIMIITCFYFIEIPIYLSFNIPLLSYAFQDSNRNLQIKTASFFLFLFEIVVNLNTIQLKRGEIINDRKKIMKIYVRNNFLKDMISLIYFIVSPEIFSNPLSSNHMSIPCKLLSLFFFLRFINLSEIISRIEELLYLDESISNKISFLKLIVNVYIFAHFFACVWNYVGMIDSKHSWLQELDLVNAVWWEKYLNALYYVVVVMTTVGFGDITSQNYYEKVFNIIFIFFGCTMFAFIFNSIGIILQNLNKQHQIYKREMYLINGYMKRKNIDLSTRSKIRNYLDYIWKEEKMTNFEEAQKIINKLSESLREDLFRQSRGQIFSNLPFFSKNFSSDVLNKLVNIVEEVNFTPGETIIDQNEVKEPCIYIIRNGSVERYVQNQANNETLTVLEKLKEGEMFGEVYFITNKKQEISTRSTTFTTLYVIRKEKFLGVISKSEFDFETFCHMRDNVIFNDDWIKLNIRCTSCHETTHLTRDCPLFQLIISKNRVLDKYNFSLFQERTENFQRKKKKKLKTKKFMLKQISSQTSEKNDPDKVLEEEKEKENQDTNLSVSWSDLDGFMDVPSKTFDSFNKEICENVDPESGGLRPRKLTDNPISFLEDVRKNNDNKKSYSPMNILKKDQLAPSPNHRSDSGLLLFSSKEKEDLEKKKSNEEQLIFETMKDYEFYFPSYNVDDVIKKYNKISINNRMRSFTGFSKRIAGFLQHKKDKKRNNSKLSPRKLPTKRPPMRISIEKTVHKEKIKSEVFKWMEVNSRKNKKSKK